MNWTEYEIAIFETCKLYFVGAEIKRDVKLIGKYSKAKRQIDILIQERIGGNDIKIIIDCKLYNKKVDVKDVESFISMAADIGAEKGLMITEQGYTEAALQRAFNNPDHIELDIYSLKDLKSNFHGELAIPYSGENGALLLAPFGWIIDASKRPGSLCYLYQRGLSLEEAGKQKELAYINFWDKSKSNFELKDLVNYQEEYMREKLPVNSIEYKESIKREDAKTLIRIAKVANYPGIELTGFIEFDDFILFCVWFSREVVILRNIRKLESLMKFAIPVKIRSHE
ncbi:MAG: restriction endonuclease [Bacteroidia bacterium]